MKRTVDLKFLFIVLLGIGCAAVGVHFLHAFQTKRNAGALLVQADRAEDAGNLAEATLLLRRYLRFVPDNSNALLKLGMLSAKNAETLNSYGEALAAFFFLNRVLQVDSANREARQKVVGLAMRIQRYSDAQMHLKKLLADPHFADKEKQAELKFLYAVCLKKDKRYANAAEEFEKAAELSPTMLAAYEEATFLYRHKLDAPAKAGAQMDKMIENNKDVFQAYLSRATYYINYSNRDKKVLQKAADDIEKARAKAPQDPRVVLVSGNLHRVLGDNKQARAILTKGLADHPNNHNFYVSLADLEAREGYLDKGLELLRGGLKVLTSKASVRNKLLDLLIEKGELAEALAAIQQLRDEKYPEPLVKYQEARILIAQGEWGRAGQLLSAIRESLLEYHAIMKGVDLLRGYCFEKLGNPDQALLAYQDAVALDPVYDADKGVGNPRVKLAQTYLALDRLDEALNEFIQISTFKKAPPAVHLAIARLMMLRNLRLPRLRRDWPSVNDRLAEAEKRLPEEVEVVLLKADALLLQDPQNKEKARQLLVEARKRKPERPELWIALAALAALDKNEDALEILDDAGRQPKLKTNRDIFLARLRYLPRIADAVTRLKKLEDTVLVAQGEDRPRLLSGLANAYVQAGDQAGAARVWRVLAGDPDQSRNLGLRLVLFDLAYTAEKHGECEDWLKEIRKLEGEAGGSYWRYGEASMILAKAKKAGLSAETRRSLAAAHEYLAKAAKLRRSWLRVPALEAEINVLEGHKERAIDNLQEAVRLGDRRPLTVYRLVKLLYDKNRFEDIEKAVSKLLDRQETLISAGLGQLATEALLRLNERERAEDVALRSVSRESKDFREHLWLGEILRAVGKHDLAKTAFTKACALAPGEPSPWIALVRLLAKTKKTDEAEVVIARAEKSLPADKVALTLAHCYHAVGRMELAEKHFVAAYQARPADLQTVEDIAAFYTSRYDQKNAEIYWRKIVDAKERAEPELVRRARRNLALATAITSDYQRFQPAIGLLDENLKDTNLRGKQDPVDLLAKALLLSTRAGRRVEAIRMFEDMEREHLLLPEHRFALAKLYVAAGNWPKAQLQIRTLLGAEKEKRSPAYYSFYIRQLLQRGEIATAQLWLAGMEKDFRDSLTTLGATARVLQAQGKDDQAISRFKAIAERKGVDPGRLALIVSEVGDKPDANPAYRRLAEQLHREKLRQAPDQGSLLALAVFLGRDKRVDEALDCCEQALAKGSPEPALMTAVAVLRVGRADRKQGARVEGWLQDKLKSNRQSVPLLHALADLRDWQERFPEAAELYGTLAQKNPRDVLALNNRAWILAHQGRHKEALELIDAAAALVGPEPEILDTRGVIYLAFNTSDMTGKAVDDLQVTVDAEPSAARLCHLAQALYQAGRLRDAADAFKKAQAQRFTDELVHPLERDRYRRLVDGLERRQAGRIRAAAK